MGAQFQPIDKMSNLKQFELCLTPVVTGRTLISVFQQSLKIFHPKPCSDSQLEGHGKLKFVFWAWSCPLSYRWGVRFLFTLPPLLLVIECGWYERWNKEVLIFQPHSFGFISSRDFCLHSPQMLRSWPRMQKVSSNSLLAFHPVALKSFRPKPCSDSELSSTSGRPWQTKTCSDQAPGLPLGYMSDDRSHITLHNTAALSNRVCFPGHICFLSTITEMFQ